MTTLTIRKKDGTEVEVQAEGVQAPPAKLGQHSLNGIVMIASPDINPGDTINPATGAPYAQVGLRAPTQISPPPTKNFR